jgi:uncharacterized ferredoxin-like protein
MSIAGRTAPKSAGQDYVVIRIIEDDEVQALGEKMAEYGERTGKKDFDRDGKNVTDSDAVVLIGINDAKSVNLDCGAVKTASILNVDNRIMYRAGVVAREMGLVDADFVMGIPLSATGKSIYFDRK